MGMFFALMSFLKIFRVSESVEIGGLDAAKHEGAVYSNKSWSEVPELGSNGENSIPS